MTSVIRVKRKRQSEPVEALLLARKKLKNEWDKEVTKSDMADVIKIEEKVFHFAGTVEPEVAHSQHVVAEKVQEAMVCRRQQKENMKSGVRKRKFPRFVSNTYHQLPKIKQLKDSTIAICQSMIREKCLNCASEPKPLSFSSKDKKNEFTTRPCLKDDKVTCQTRSATHQDDEEMNIKNDRHIQESIMCNNIKMFREKLNVSQKPVLKKSEFVYDLYYSKDNTSGWDMTDLLYVQPYRYNEDDLLNASSSEEEVYEDEDDSNDEGNWRNEYPDDEDNSSDSTSTSEDDWDRFVQQEEEDEQDDDDLDAGADGADDCSKYPEMGQEDYAYQNDFEEEVMCGGYENDQNEDPNADHDTGFN